MKSTLVVACRLTKFYINRTANIYRMSTKLIENYYGGNVMVKYAGQRCLKITICNIDVKHVKYYLKKI